MLHELAARHLVQVAQHGKARGHWDLVHDGTYKLKQKAGFFFFAKKKQKTLIYFACVAQVEL
jgi:hypothetical protein